MNKLRSAFGTHQKESDEGLEIRDVNFDEKKASDEKSPDYEAGSNKAIALDVVKSQEFDPVTSHMEDIIAQDEYAAVHVEDDSPYPEVRSAVPSTDDPSVMQNTIRMWTVGLILTTIGCGMNLLFSFHSPSFSITTYVTSILAWPIGKAWEKFLPNWKIFGVGLNPGPFTLKEHALITIMGSVSFGGGTAYATDILMAQNRFYKSDFGTGFAIVAVLSTQLIGLSLGGLARQFLVDASGAVWPASLVTTTFLTNMHINENHPVHGWNISRLRFFTIVFCCSFVWYFFPGFIFQALSYFAWPTWIRPNNVILNQVFGASTGLGLFPLTFDWNQVAGYIGSPLIPDSATIWTIFLSIVVIFWIIVPGIHYSNTWYAQYLPISSSGSYDRYGQTYNVSKIVDIKTLTFNKEEYSKYSPLFLSTTFAISYGLSFASMTATLVHTVLFHGRELWDEWKNRGRVDVHIRLSRQNYKQIPPWWYGILFLISFGLSIATIRAWNTEMPVWCLVIALLIALLFLLPVGIIYAKTNIAVGLNVITEFIIGYMLPGKPIAMMFFKTYGYITNNQAVLFAQDMKTASVYLKCAPRLAFWAQLIATIWGSLVQVGVLRWAYGNIDDLCAADQKQHYTCPNGRVFFNASIIWGVIGPERQFSHGQLYYGLLFFFLIGAILPVVSWLILKKWPKCPIKHINWPVFFSGTGYIPPATPYNYGAYSMVGLIFGWFIKRKYFHWWSKYNYSLSAGLDIGLAWSLLIVFLCLNLTNATLSWWGNDVINTSDTLGTAVRVVLGEGESFGPKSW